MNERDPQPCHERDPGAPTHEAGPTWPPYHERDPLTPALLAEASIPPTWLPMLRHFRAYSLATRNRPRPSTQPPSPPAPAPRSRPRSSRASHALGAQGTLSVSAEAMAESTIIFAVINDRRAIGDFTRWWEEAQHYIDIVIPSRRHLLQRYADTRALIRRRRLVWKLAEHITDLDDTLDSFPPIPRRQP
jgi:hypothetical protein